MLFENRLDDTISFSQFVDGEGVEIRTKMGNVLASGYVMSVVPNGLIVRESSGDTKFYSNMFHLFASLEKKYSVTDENQLHDMSLDDRVNRKLKSMKEGDDVDTDDKTGAKPLDPNYVPKNKEDTVKDAKKNSMIDPDSSVDVSKLPSDIKSKILTTDKIDEFQVNSVLGDITNAALKALKRNGVSEIEIFGLVQKIGDASYEILVGEKPNKEGKPK